MLDDAAASEALHLRHLALTPDRRMEARVVRTLAWLHWHRWNSLPEGAGQQDLSIAVGLFGAMVEDDPMAVPSQVRRYHVDQADPARRARIGTAMLSHLEQADDADALTEAIDALSQAAETLPEVLSNLSYAYLMRYERGGDRADIEQAVATGERAAELRPDAVSALVNLGNALRLLHAETGVRRDLDRALQVNRRAALAATGEIRATIALNQAIMLLARYDTAGNRADLDAALQEAQRAVDADPQRPLFLAGLAAVRLARGDLTAGLDAACAAVRNTPIGHPDRPRRLDLLADVLRAINSTYDDPATLGLAIDAAVEQLPDQNATLVGSLFQHRYALTSALGDLDQAIAFGQRGPTDPGQLSSLGNAFAMRHQLTGATVDIERAVELHQRAAADDPGHPGWLMNLSNALRLRYEHTDDPADLDASVAASRSGLQLSDDTTRPGQRANLAATLVFRSHAVGSPADLDEAIEQLRQAIAEVPADYEYRALYKSNLAIALRTHATTMPAGRFSAQELLRRQAADRADLDEAVDLLRDVVRGVAPSRPERSTFLANLAATLGVRHGRTGALDDLNEAVQLWQAATDTNAGPVAERVRAARDAARTVAGARGPADAAPHYLAAIALLPLLIWRGNTLTDQHQFLRRYVADLAGDAAAAAVAAAAAASAVEAAEHARGVLWTQLLDTRTDLSALQQVDPDLATRLTTCRALLDRPLLHH
ncbi:hypothetical protein [Dactylosporangium sp. NPDC005555]|uniref:hypothetical protein n=1 Tax=Dactylosporangium sp. NPDC005555 TaxID=3154889 RepID=UPI0033A0486C